MISQTTLAPSPLRIDDATRREVLRGLGLLGAGWVLVACGTAEDAPPAAATRRVDHPLGFAEVPVDAQRIIALTGTEELDALAALGVAPIAAAELEQGIGFSPGAARLLGDSEVTMLGTRREIDLEVVAAQRPDLILGTEGWLAEVYDQLSAIAPTVSIDGYTGAAQILRDVAAALGRGDAAEEAIAAVEADVDGLVEAADEALEGLTYCLVKPFPEDGEYGLYQLPDIDDILQRLGMTRREAQMALFTDDSGYAAISTEQVDIIDTDVVLLFGYDEPADAAAIQTMLADPLFARLPAAQRGTVFSVDSASWYFYSVLAVSEVVADLQDRIIPAVRDAI